MLCMSECVCVVFITSDITFAGRRAQTGEATDRCKQLPDSAGGAAVPLPHHRVRVTCFVGTVCRTSPLLTAGSKKSCKILCTFVLGKLSLETSGEEVEEEKGEEDTGNGCTTRL